MLFCNQTHSPALLEVFSELFSFLCTHSINIALLVIIILGNQIKSRLCLDAQHHRNRYCGRVILKAVGTSKLAAAVNCIDARGVAWLSGGVGWLPFRRGSDTHLHIMSHAYGMLYRHKLPSSLVMNLYYYVQILYFETH